MAHDTTQPKDMADSIEDLTMRAADILERHPKLAPMLTELLCQINRCTGDIDENEALACMRFHARHPELAEMLMHFVQAAREQNVGTRGARPGDG